MTPDRTRPNPLAGPALTLARAAATYPVRATLAVTAVLSVLLVLFPGIDLAVSGLFYEPGRGFPAAAHPVLTDLRELGMASFKLLVAAALVGLAVPFLAGGARFLLPPRAALFLLSAAVLGPGVLVNLVFKETWGRARPRSVVEFGGDAPFSAPWAMVDHCVGNCSFVSGEASTSILLLALALIASPGWKRPVAIGALLFAAAVSLNRIAFGGHFLSDVLISWCLTVLVMLLVHRAIYRPGSRFTDEAIAGALGRAGAAAGRGGARALAAGRRFLARFR